jgi:ABC-type multidrug transport system permease subunit
LPVGTERRLAFEHVGEALELGWDRCGDLSALLLFLGYAFSWVFAFIGLSASSPEASNAYGFTILFPVTFVSSAFVPPQSMPSWLEAVADVNPFTTMVDAIRALFLGTPAGNDVWGAVVWAVVIILVFGALSVWRYQRAVTR